MAMQSGGSGAGIRCLRWGLGAALVAGVSSCARIGYEPLDAPFDGLSPASIARTGDGRLRDAGSASDASALPATVPGEPDAGGFDPPPSGDSGSSAPPDSGSAPTGGICQLLGTEQVVSGFDSSPAGVQARGPGNPTLSWTGSVGSPELGALEFLDPSGAGGEVFYNGPLGDLSARGVSLNVQFVSGAGVRARMFAESGATRRRAWGPYTNPALAQWDCAHIDPSAPASAESGFDAADIVGLGIELLGTGSLRVYIDQIAY